jgi:hypothetical protein
MAQKAYNNSVASSIILRCNHIMTQYVVNDVRNEPIMSI